MDFISYFVFRMIFLSYFVSFSYCLVCFSYFVASRILMLVALLPEYLLRQGPAGRNRLSAEPWLRLGGDNRLGRLKMWAGKLGLRASWQPSSVNRFSECASCSEGCLAQPSNLGLGHVPELPISAPLRCGEGKGQSEQFGAKRCTHTKIILVRWPAAIFAAKMAAPPTLHRPGH